MLGFLGGVFVFFCQGIFDANKPSQKLRVCWSADPVGVETVVKHMLLGLQESSTCAMVL